MKIQQLFAATATAQPQRLAVVGHDGRLTCAELATESRRLADALRLAGLAPGDRIAVWMGNSVAAAVALWGALEAGGVIVPIHAAARGPALATVARDADPAWVLFSTDLMASLPPLRAALPPVTRFVAFGSDDRVLAQLSGADLRWSVAAGLPAIEGRAAANWRADLTRAGDPSLAALLYTSGSTGEPKGVMLSHANMVAAMRAVQAYLQLGPDDVLYSALPLSSSYGLYQLLLGLAVGVTVVLDRSFAFPLRSLQLLAAEACTVVAGVPTTFAWLAAAPSLGSHDLSRLRLLTSAAAALPVEHARGVLARLPQARLCIMYGQTECKRISFLDPDDFARKPGSVGRGMPFQEHLLLDEQGAVVDGEGTGELCVQGPHVMLGYWRNPAATAAKLGPVAGRSGVWLRTGDLFRVDAEGFLWFLGRQDELLKVGGHKVSPREIEDVLCDMPAVREAAVTGVPDERLGQAAKAWLVLRDGQTVTAEEVVRFCSGRLRGYMVPKAVQIVADLPRTESGKINKRQLA
jgi:long-chain acyl-CoA synthetase